MSHDYEMHCELRDGTARLVRVKGESEEVAEAIIKNEDSMVVFACAITVDGEPA